ncbi:MAG: tRNA (adenosine(37)-N6)-dimethylallyltransferase MiaA [Proteobacteria bacterium]|nr:tRNA (adenosine(37)-N6)-dimethylallyltransferase MiaA [Pseudomonadota bacterium]MBU2226464.1 tRNA (adenosine(37)-N6)-dimethylallyltransferase MiaA [Pseudomonadota bacterium]MBU2262766.1 tRNA (adenosine(37)-N6)-dimethylallyltransferase MiaA [Pseudomonadota bacterium]
MIDEEAIRGFRERYNLLVVLGPTASGKTGIAIRLARRISGEIISADSRQVYTGMDLGTGKDLSAYGRDGPAVPCHLIDIIPPTEEFSLFAYQERFYRCFQEISGRGNVPILTGGTGLYLDAVVRDYRLQAAPENRSLREELAKQEMPVLRRRFLALCPAIHNTTDLRERKRLIRAIEIAEFARDHPREAEPSVRIVPLVIGIRCRREDLRHKITARLESRLEAGMIEEVRQLHASGVPWERLDSFGLEYRYIALYLQGKMAEKEMFQTLNTRIHQFAKRQETWFRRMERKGVRIHWVEGADEGADEAAALDLIAGRTA